MARRQKILGLPIGKKKSRVSARTLVAAGAGLAAALPGAVATARKVGDLVSSGSQAVETVSDLSQKADRMKEAIGQHGTTIGKIGAAVSEISKLSGGDDGPPKLSHLIEEHTEIAVPREVAYNQWTQFEMFPSIVKGAERVEQTARDKTSWTSKIGPSRREWTAEITEQVPDERIAWKSSGGLQQRGVVTFHSLDEELTRVLVEIEYSPRGPVEHVGNLLRIQRRRVRRDLRLYKHFLELRGEATGAWRSRIAKKDDAEGASSRGSHRSPRQSSSSSNGSKQGTRNRKSNGNGGRKASGSRSASASRKASGSRKAAGNGKASGSRGSTHGQRHTTKGKAGAAS